MERRLPAAPRRPPFTSQAHQRRCRCQATCAVLGGRGVNMRRTFDRGVLAGIGLVVALLAVNAGLAYRNTRQLNEDAGWVAHTHEVLDLTADVLLTLVDAETGQRGFLLTGKEDFLEPYHQALLRLDQQVRTLK